MDTRQLHTRARQKKLHVGAKGDLRKLCRITPDGRVVTVELYKRRGSEQFEKVPKRSWQTPASS